METHQCVRLDALDETFPNEAPGIPAKRTLARGWQQEAQMLVPRPGRKESER